MPHRYPASADSQVDRPIDRKVVNERRPWRPRCARLGVGEGEIERASAGVHDAHDDVLKPRPPSASPWHGLGCFVERIECRPFLLALKAEGLLLAGKLAAVFVGKRLHLLPFVETGSCRDCPPASRSEPK